MPDPPPPNSASERRPKSRHSPEELARDAIAHEKIVVGGKVRMTFNMILTRKEGPWPLGRFGRRRTSPEWWPRSCGPR